MAKVGIFYGSTTGVTEDIANRIAEKIDGAEVFNIDGNVDELENYDVLLLGTSTWGFGDLQDDWQTVLDELSNLDLKGKKVLICLGCNYQKMLTEYDTKNEINPGNYEGSETIALEEIAEGKIDATIHDRLVAAYFNKKKGSELIETVGDVMEKKSVYFVYRKDAKGEEIKSRMNKALEEMKKDGTLAKLSMQWFNLFGKRSY